MNKSGAERRKSEWGSEGTVLNNVQQSLVSAYCLLPLLWVGLGQTLEISTIALGLSEEQWCVYKPEVTLETLAGYKMVLHGTHNVVVSHYGSDLDTNNVTSHLHGSRESAETSNVLIDESTPRKWIIRVIYQANMCMVSGGNARGSYWYSLSSSYINYNYTLFGLWGLVVALVRDMWKYGRAFTVIIQWSTCHQILFSCRSGWSGKRHTINNKHKFYGRNSRERWHIHIIKKVKINII